MTEVVRIAMWSGPRNVSTALMRSFGSRPDTHVCDEPFYAHWLQCTGTEHPGREEVCRRHETDWRAVVATLTGPLPAGKTVSYQKHMAHHLLPDIGRQWLTSMRHAFLVREPRAMLASLAEVVPRPTLFDTGLPQQVELFEQLAARDGRPPPVVDSRDLLADPAAVLGQLCAQLGIAYDARMLAWEPGPRATDGCWAPHWYAAVEASTGFQAPSRMSKRLPSSLAPLAEACEQLYARLHRYRITA